ncbi:hypothetical protein NM688_g8549 [Phlebia brevispora]|uniref:Uncharacterized protein n=1 Tax=Phlebia brevispora TaxID=194682 RepID=A0ACC1RTN3_9APHY|nr:hypothetical protein NM688_g8549 [Phlebia brevispora]
MHKKPKLRQGVRMRLWQLTDKEAHMKGFVQVPVFINSREGDCLALMAEAYVVPHMSVPILLREDFQRTYEINVMRRVDFGTEVKLHSGRYTIEARGVRRTGDFARVQRAENLEAHFVRAKAHRRSKNRRQREKAKLLRRGILLRCARDTPLASGSCKQVPIEGLPAGQEDWLLERALVTSSESDHLVIPNLLLSTSSSHVPVANPSTRPRILRKGEVLGVLRRARDALDRPTSHAQYVDMCHEADHYAAYITALRSVNLSETRSEGIRGTCAEDGPYRVFVVETDGTAHATEQPLTSAVLESANRNDTMSMPKGGDVEESGPTGPKTAEVPDSSRYSSQDMKTILDVGQLPQHLQARAWNMLR